MHYPIPSLSHHELTEGLRELLERERTNLADTVEWLIYVNYYKPFIQEGYFSLYDYLERGCGMSRNQAFKRHTAVRLIDYFPRLMVHLRSGELSLSHIVALSGHLSEASYDVIVPEILGRPIDDARKVIASIGLDGRPTGIQTLHTITLRISEETLGRVERVRQLAADQGMSTRLEDVIDDLLIHHINKHDPMARAQRALARKANKERHHNQISSPCDATDLSEEMRGAQCGEEASSGITLLRQIERVALAQSEAQREAGTDIFRETKGDGHPGHGATAAPVNHSSDLFEETPTREPMEKRKKAGRRTVPAMVRHQVMLRDGGQCTFVSQEGVRCSARTFLEFDHKMPFSCGGPHTPENIRLRCRAHNLHAACQTFGRRFMKEKIHARTGKVPSSPWTSPVP